MRTLLVMFLFIAVDAKSQNPKVENFCQYLDQPIHNLLANLKSAVVDTIVERTNTGKFRSFLLVFTDSSYFEVLPLLNKTNDALMKEQFNLKNYLDYKIRCLFYHVPGDVVDNCGCKNSVQ